MSEKISDGQRALLMAVAELGEASSVEVWRRVGGSVGALHAVANCLEARGLLRTWPAPGGDRRNFRPRRMFALTAAGRAALENDR